MEQTAFFRPQTANETDRTVEICFSTGSRVLRHSADGSPYYEELLVSAEAIDLSRLNSGAPLLSGHRSEQLTDQIGVVEKAWVDGGNAMALVRFSERKEVTPIFRDISSGILRGISVGYQILDSHREERSGDAYPTLVAKLWQPLEISIVSIPADHKASVRSQPIPTPKEPQINLRSAMSLFERHGISMQEGGNIIERASTMEDVNRLVLDKLTKDSEKRSIHVVRDERDNKRQLTEEALLHKIDRNKPVSREARQYATMSLVDIARQYAEPGHRSLSKEEVLSRAFQSSSDFPEILGNLAKKTLLEGYEKLTARQEFQPLVRIGSVPDFKPMRRVRLSELPDLKEIPEGKEYETATLGEEAEEYKIATYGRTLALTRQSFINDDLGAFQALSHWGAACARLESSLVWSIFNDNPKMGSGIPIFHEKHGNLTKKSTPLTLDSLSEARMSMMRQKGLTNDAVLGIVPDYLVVPPELEMEAFKLMSRETSPTNLAEVNPLKGAFKVIVAPWLKDRASWYVCASADQGLDLIELFYLDGIRSPYVEWFPCFENDVMKVKARLDVGAKALDYRGFYKGIGAGVAA